MNHLSTIPLHERPARVRGYFEELGISGVIVTRGDNYLGEYVASNAERLAWISGFTGSAGLAILTSDAGCVFSDGRYTVQMEEQIPHELWGRQHILQDPPSSWLKTHAAGRVIGYDPRLVSESALKSWEAPGVTLVPLATNPIDSAWTDQPAAPAGPISQHPLAYTGEESQTKRERLAEHLRAAGQDAMILADCTSIAWLLNIRGTDVPMTPVAHGYCILHNNGHADYFVNDDRLTFTPEAGITLHNPETLSERLQSFVGKVVRLDAATTPVWFTMELERHGAEVVRDQDLCSVPKAIKNATEQAGNRRAHELDSIALARFLHWIEQEGVGKHETDLAKRLTAFRALNPEYRGESFETISAVGSNGAYPHYRAEVGRDKVLEENSVYLVDSGGQYPFGTTDITRTIWIGSSEPSQDVRQAFTHVLKGNIQLSQQRFPYGLPGYRLDTLARAALWNIGLDYDHGTGHGIGSYLSVHEGPQSITSAPRPTGLVPGMILSNEPGYYATGAYGIRIENLLLVKESALKGPRGPFLEFEVLTFTPIDRRLIDVSLLSDDECAWIDRYHARVQKHLLDAVEPELHEWVRAKCAPLEHSS